MSSSTPPKGPQVPITHVVEGFDVGIQAILAKYGQAALENPRVAALVERHTAAFKERLNQEANSPSGVSQDENGKVLLFPGPKPAPDKPAPVPPTPT
ncbi:MAG: hypothetical protein ACI9QC_000744 [Oceanicoccus sp.]|jgi:hypothetical protein